MSDFSSGVKSYVKAQAVITVGFPVNFNGNAEICCKHCPYLSSNERMCQLNKQPVAYPMRYVGEFCPLEKIKEMTEE